MSVDHSELQKSQELKTEAQRRGPWVGGIAGARLGTPEDLPASAVAESSASGLCAVISLPAIGNLPGTLLPVQTQPAVTSKHASSDGFPQFRHASPCISSTGTAVLACTR